MNRKIFYFSLLSVAVTSCGTINNKQAVGDFEYAKQPEVKALAIPAGLEQPFRAKTFAVTDKINKAGPIGANVDVRAPSLVLPIAASTRVESGSAQAKVWFDQVLEETDLKIFIVDALNAQLNADNVAVKIIDEQGLVYESDWYHREVEEGTWPFNELSISESIRYRYTLEGKPHGRSVALNVELIEYLRTDKDGGSKKIDLIDQQRAEMNMLNEVISQVDYRYRLKQQENRLLRANQKFVSLGENSQAEAAYIVEMSADLLWANLPLFFEDHNFSIEDMNESEMVYFVDYVQPESSLWDSIWGDDLPVVDLPNGKYQFKLESLDEKSSVTIYNAQGTALPAKTLEDIFTAIEPGLSFKDAF